MPNRPVEFMQEYVLKACVLSPERVIEFGDYSDELQERLASLEIVDDNAALALQSPIADGWKIGGYPKWIQSPDTPICPSCGQPMEHLLSIDSEEFDSMSEDRWMATEDARRGRSSNWKTQEAISRPTGIMLGDVGCQYYFVCRQCDPNRVVTVFQSS